MQTFTTFVLVHKSITVLVKLSAHHNSESGESGNSGESDDSGESGDSGGSSEFADLFYQTPLELQITQETCQSPKNSLFWRRENLGFG